MDLLEKFFVIKKNKTDSFCCKKTHKTLFLLKYIPYICRIENDNICIVYAKFSF